MRLVPNASKFKKGGKKMSAVGLICSTTHFYLECFALPSLFILIGCFFFLPPGIYNNTRKVKKLILGHKIAINQFERRLNKAIIFHI